MIHENTLSGYDQSQKRYVTLDDDVVVLLDEEAERSGISPDKLLEYIITRAATFDILLSKIEMVETPLSELYGILECIS
jgi:hypothetical protein